MKFQIDHDFHIHSQYSSCSDDPAQNNETILAYALENGLRDIVLTNHYWDAAVPGASDWYQPQDYDHIAQALPLPQHENCRFHFGCETDMDRFMTIGVPKERYDCFDFIIVPTTHLHMDGFTYFAEEADTIEKRAALFVRRLDAFLDADLPFHKVGLAHITCPLILYPGNDYLDVLAAVSDEDFARLFRRCAEKGCGIEINIDFEDLTSREKRPIVLRPYRIAKEQGCKFYLGGDAHHPEELPMCMERFALAIDLLGLTEDDKFRLPED